MDDTGRYATRYAARGMVCSVDHVASSAGVSVLRAGGSAVDAAVATSAVLAVTTPHMCGMGGDLFALVHSDTGPPAVLNASGRAGSGADAARLRAEGHTLMPFRHDLRSTPVPGCVDGWLALHERYGRLPLAEVLAPAIECARDGFAVGAFLAAMLPLVAEADGAGDFFTPAPLRPGARCRRARVADALGAIVRDGRAGFYEGAFGEGLLEMGGGEYEPEDLATPMADWVEPVGRRVWDHDLWTVPPNSQGYLTVASAWIAADLLPDEPDDPAWPHMLIEASRQAAYDRQQVLFEGADGDALLAPDRLAPRRAAIRPDATVDLPGPARSGDTIYLCAVDRDRMAVSLIQSNAADFGAHVIEPRTGIFLHNRGIGFNLVPGHPAEYGPRRRPPSTLSPALVTRPDGSARAVVGTMGGDVQPQIVLQLLARLLAAHQRPGRAVRAPRWVLRRPDDRGFDLWADAARSSSLDVAIEADAPPSWFDGLADRGHRLQTIGVTDSAVGHAHLIDISEDGTLAGAADPRAEGSAAVGW